jgi:transcription termination factor Rho
LRSSTRKEELLLDEEELRKVTKMRRMINMLDDEEQTMVFMDRLKKTKDNKEFLDKIDQGV